MEDKESEKALQEIYSAWTLRAPSMKNKAEKGILDKHPEMDSRTFTKMRKWPLDNHPEMDSRTFTKMRKWRLDKHPEMDSRALRRCVSHPEMDR